MKISFLFFGGFCFTKKSQDMSKDHLHTQLGPVISFVSFLKRIMRFSIRNGNEDEHTVNVR